MSRPDDVTQEAWDAASLPAEYIDPIDRRYWISRAIMAAKAEEREACAVHIDAMSDGLYEKADTLDLDGRDEAFAAWVTSNISKAIRARSTKP